MRRSDSKTAKQVTQVIGEPFMIGIDQGQLEPFLASHSCEEIRYATSEELKRLYFSGSNARRTINSGAAIASATVDKFDVPPS